MWFRGPEEAPGKPTPRDSPRGEHGKHEGEGAGRPLGREGEESLRHPTKKASAPSLRGRGSAEEHPSRRGQGRHGPVEPLPPQPPPHLGKRGLAMLDPSNGRCTAHLMAAKQTVCKKPRLNSLMMIRGNVFGTQMPTAGNPPQTLLAWRAPNVGSTYKY